MTYKIYRLLTRLIFAITFPVFLAYTRFTGKHKVGLRQRLGFYQDIIKPKTGKLVVWIHGASVGEVMVARTLAGKIKTVFPDVDLIISTVTEQGLKVAQGKFADMAQCVLAPLDLPEAADRAIETIRPDIYICLETELWPTLLTRLQANNTRLFLLNGRLSEKSSRRYRLIKDFAGKILGGFEAISTISATDADRFIGLGADRDKTIIAGNIKYDLPEPVAPAETRAKWRQQFNLGDKQPVLIGGSTHTGEEKMLLEVFHKLKTTLPDLVLIIAPRHLNRQQDISSDFANSHADHDTLSSIKSRGRLTDIIIVDTIGDLAELYSAADIIFCGGSLVKRGGHNIIEAAMWGVPVLYGPNMKDFNDAQLLLEGNGGLMVQTQVELADKIRELFTNPHLYKKLAAAAGITARSQQGAASKQLSPVFDAITSICSNDDARGN